MAGQPSKPSRIGFAGAIALTSFGLAVQTSAQTPTENANGQSVLYLYGYIDADGDRPGETDYEGDPFHPMRLDNVDPGASGGTDFDRGMSGFKTALEDVGFNVSQARDDQLTLNQTTLNSHDVLILGSNNRRFTQAETQAVHTFVDNGGGVVAWSDSAFGGHYNQVGINNRTGARSDNDLISQFGLTLLPDSGNDFSTPGKDPDNTSSEQEGEGIQDYLLKHYINNNQTDGTQPGGITFYGEGVSPVRIDPNSNAMRLALLQNGSTKIDDLDDDSSDDDYNAQTDAALAYSTLGDGRVVATFDRNTFWNDGEGTDLGEVDNKAFAQRLILWASGEGAVPEPASAGLMLGSRVVLLQRAR